VGISIRRPLLFTAIQLGARAALNALASEQLEWGAVADYQGVPISRVRPQPGSAAAQFLGGEENARQPFALYHVLTDGGWYISTRQAPLREQIDRGNARFRNGEADGRDLVPVSASLYVAPGAAVKSREAVQSYLESQTHRRAVANGPIWQALVRAGMIDRRTPEPKMNDAALRLLGFVPVSPDGSAYAYQAKTDEVVNRRHGSLRRPQRHAALDPSAPLGRLLQQVRWLRADLRFPNEGIRLVLTVEQKR
jgi:hypothetical protein